MLLMEKGSVEFLFIPVLVEGALPELIEILPYAIAVHPLGVEADGYWKNATYSPEAQTVSVLLDTGLMDRGDYRIKVKVIESPETPVKDCGILRIR